MYGTSSMAALTNSSRFGGWCCIDDMPWCIAAGCSAETKASIISRLIASLSFHLINVTFGCGFAIALNRSMRCEQCVFVCLTKTWHNKTMAHDLCNRSIYKYPINLDHDDDNNFPQSTMRMCVCACVGLMESPFDNWIHRTLLFRYF